MPYRRLPNTDAARLKALKTAFGKGKEVPPFQLAFSQSTYQKASLFLPTYEQAILQYNLSYKSQTNKSKEYQAQLKKARMYISHFIQVVNMAIARGELKEDIRTIFGIEKGEKKVPSLVSEQEVITWGQNIIEGENKRRFSGGSPITNPTIAVVKVRYENFIEAYNHQKTLQKNTQRTLSELNEKRSIADEIILEIWNEVEEHYKDLPENERRENAQKYGLVYVYRKNELNKLDFFNSNNLNT